MRNLFLLLAGGAIGAGLSWLCDNERGEARRTMVRDRLMQAKEQAMEQAESVSREMGPRVEHLKDLRDRTMAETRS